MDSLRNEVPRATAIIPARYASVRFPGKVLADKTGKPLLEHVYERVCRAELVERVIIAADDRRIIKAVEDFGGEAIMTRSDHPNGTNRIAEVAHSLSAELVVNVQADEPEIEPELIDRAVRVLEDHPECVMSTLAARFSPDEDPADPNIVKVALDASSRAKSFSRALITPDHDGGDEPGPLKHVGLYVYRREFLLLYPTLDPTPLERQERLEQLRVLEHGFSIAVGVVSVLHHGIDTPQQYEEFVRRERKRHDRT